MSSYRPALAGTAVALVLALSACGADTDGGQPPADAAGEPAAPSTGAPPSPAEREPATAEEAAVEAAFRGWQQALAAKDFAAACGLNTTEANEALVGALTAGGAPVETCEEGYALVLNQPEALETSRVVAETAQVQDVVVEGENATVTWSAQVQDQRPTTENGLRLVDGQWRMLPMGG